MHRHRLPAGVALHAPDLIHQLDAGEDFSRERQQLVQQIKLLLWQYARLVLPFDGKRVVIKLGVAADYFMLVGVKIKL